MSARREQAAQMLRTLPDSDVELLIAIMERMSIEMPEEPNGETLEAIAEAEEMEANPERYPGYTDLDQMWEDLQR